MSATKFTGAKARIRRVPTPPILRVGPAGVSEWSWRASVPGEYYLVADGLHHYTWESAMAYVHAQFAEKAAETP